MPVSFLELDVYRILEKSLNSKNGVYGILTLCNSTMFSQAYDQSITVMVIPGSQTLVS
jgi:hypothetical protein